MRRRGPGFVSESEYVDLLYSFSYFFFRLLVVSLVVSRLKLGLAVYFMAWLGDASAMGGMGAL